MEITAEQRHVDHHETFKVSPGPGAVAAGG
jgi:hypothetical protein